jgi:hypothetical protein
MIRYSIITYKGAASTDRHLSPIYNSKRLVRALVNLTNLSCQNRAGAIDERKLVLLLLLLLLLLFFDARQV